MNRESFVSVKSSEFDLISILIEQHLFLITQMEVTRWSVIVNLFIFDISCSCWRIDTTK